MRWVTLYLRSRSIPLALAAMIGSTVALLVLSHSVDAPDTRDALALLAVLAGTAAIAPGLAGADPDLDRTAALSWPPRRAVHIVLAAAAVLGILAVAALTDTGPAARNVTGMCGLVTLGAVTLGASRAWLVPCLWTLLVLPFTPPLGAVPTGPGYKVVLTWMVQPSHTTSATVAAILLGTVGTLAYAVLGARR